MSTTQPIKNTEQLHMFKDYYLQIKPNSRNYLLIVMGLNSALRISDILSLTCGDVYDFNRSNIKTHIVVREHKTGKINRIFINKEIRAALSCCVCFANKTEASWLFESQMQNEQPLSRYQAYRLIKKAASYAGMDSDISCHSLRKTFGYHAWKHGAHPAVLMNIYNHSNYQITKRYLGIDQDDKDEVFRNILI